MLLEMGWTGTHCAPEATQSCRPELLGVSGPTNTLNTSVRRANGGREGGREAGMQAEKERERERFHAVRDGMDRN